MSNWKSNLPTLKQVSCVCLMAVFFLGMNKPAVADDGLDVRYNQLTSALSQSRKADVDLVRQARECQTRMKAPPSKWLHDLKMATLKVCSDFSRKANKFSKGTHPYQTRSNLGKLRNLADALKRKASSNKSYARQGNRIADEGLKYTKELTMQTKTIVETIKTYNSWRADVKRADQNKSGCLFLVC